MRTIADPATQQHTSLAPLAQFTFEQGPFAGSTDAMRLDADIVDSAPNGALTLTREVNGKLVSGTYYAQTTDSSRAAWSALRDAIAGIDLLKLGADPPPGPAEVGTSRLTVARTDGSARTITAQADATSAPWGASVTQALYAYLGAAFLGA